MARRLHLFKGDHATMVAAVIAPQVAAGDHVTIALLGGVASPPLPAAVTVRRVPDDLSYEALAKLVFAADAVVSW
jgi:hypothetical protein